MNDSHIPPARRRRATSWPAALALPLAALSVLACGGGDGADAPVEPVEPPCTVTGVSITPATAQIVRVGQSTTLAATVATGGCTAAPVTWATSNAAVATVSAAGVVTGVTGGQAAITATTGGRSDTVAVMSVVDPGVAFVYSDQASPALNVPYTPRLDFQRSPGGAPATVTRTGTGVYEVQFPDVRPAPGQSTIALASAVLTGANERVCQVDSWGILGSYRVIVRCFTNEFTDFGNPGDAPFTVQLVGAGALAGRHGFVWASQPTTATYTPDPNYATNSSGGAITITRVSLGLYRVRWAGLARSAGAVETIVAAPMGASARQCSVDDWVADGADLVATIRCANLAGSLNDAQFVVLVAEQGRPGRHFAVVWADRASASAPYDASTNGNSRTSAGGAITITRQATGTYLVHLAGLTRTVVPGGTAPETVAVTSFGTWAFGASAFCQAAIWAILPDGAHVAVECKSPFNNAKIDSQFTLYLAE